MAMLHNPAHLGACGTVDGFAAISLAADGTELWRRDLEHRAHDVIADSARGTCVVTGRKPGLMAMLCDLASGALLHSLGPLPNCTFDGHAVFSADGSELYTTQSEGRAQLGHVAVYDVGSGVLLRQFPTHGIEPHELLWSADGSALVIGNGGIVNRNATDPIHSSLVYVDAASGSCLTRLILDEDMETLSLRHLARLRDGRVVFGAQDQDPATDLRPLAGIVDESGDAKFLSMPPDAHRRMAGYIGSVAVDLDRAVICATSPRGGLAAFWAGADGRYLGAVDLPDVCGVAAGIAAGEFVLTSGHGARLMVQADATGAAVISSLMRAVDPLQWDNHLSCVGAV